MYVHTLIKTLAVMPGNLPVYIADVADTTQIVPYHGDLDVPSMRVATLISILNDLPALQPVVVGDDEYNIRAMVEAVMLQHLSPEWNGGVAVILVTRVLLPARRPRVPARRVYCVTNALGWWN